MIKTRERLFQALICCAAWALVFGACALEPAAPALEAQPGPTGLVTWWLVAPASKEALAEGKVPESCREGEPVFAGAAERWSLLVSSSSFVDLKACVPGSTGHLWTAVRIDCQAGGSRKLRVESYCGVRVFQNGKLVLDKPQPAGIATSGVAQIELPQGQTELAVDLAARPGVTGFFFYLTEAESKGAPQAAAGDKLVLPTVSGKEPDAAAAAVRSIVFIVSNSFLASRQSTVAAAGLCGSLPLGFGPLTVRFLNADGTPIDAKFPPRTVLELSREPWQAAYTLPEGAEFKQRLRAEFQAGGKVLGEKEAFVFSLAGLKKAAAALEADISGRAAKSAHPLPHALLAVEKLKLFLNKLENGEERPSQELGAALEGLLASAASSAAAEEAGKDPAEGRSGYFERAYISRIDEQPQPYFVQVPGACAKRKEGERFPLVVFLHGYVPYYDKHRWWEEMPDFNAAVDRQNAFLAIPFARSNTDFQSCGEVDVLDVIAEVKRLYPIDADRVYLYGVSMGGMAVFTLGAHYPDLFAAAVAMCGRADNPLQNFRPLEEFHPFKQWLIHADNPISLCENFLNLPLLIFHFSGDHIVKPKEAERMEARFKELGCDAKLTVGNGDHWTAFEVMATDEPLAWLLRHKRNPDPPQRRLKSYSLRYAAQDGVQILAATGDLRPLELEWASKDGECKFTRESANIVQRKVKGVLQPEKVEGKLKKTPRLCGPVREAVCGPFILVYGTSGTAEANALNKANAERMAKEWCEFTRSRAILKADTDVTPDEKKRKNLFLFGEEQDNELHSEAAPKLPFIVKDGEVVIGAQKRPLAGNGFMYIFPSPFAEAEAHCSVVICAGMPYGQEVGINHKFDLLPDFLLYTARCDNDSTSTNQPVCAGFFDGQWRLNLQTMWWFKPGP